MIDKDDDEVLFQFWKMSQKMTHLYFDGASKVVHKPKEMFMLVLPQQARTRGTQAISLINLLILLRIISMLFMNN